MMQVQDDWMTRILVQDGQVALFVLIDSFFEDWVLKT